MSGQVDNPKFTAKGNRLYKKVHGRTVYFGTDPQEAIEKYRRMIEAAELGIVAGAPTVGRLLNDFEAAAQNRIQLGNLQENTFSGYQKVTAIIAKTLNPKTPLESLTEEHFQRLAVALHRPAPSTRALYLTVAGMVFKYGADRKLIEPIRYREALALPTAKEMRRSKRERGARMFTSEQIRTMVTAAEKPWRCFILLGINCGFGCTDIENLDIGAFDLENGWHDFPRTKNENDRRCALWPETVQALRDAYPWKVKALDISMGFRRFLESVDCYKPLVTFSALRKGFATVGYSSGLESIVDLVMGHCAQRTDMRAIYRQATSDDKLRELSDYVHRWYTGELKIKGLP